MQELIEQLRGQGVALATKDGISLAVNSLQPLTEDQRATIRGNKAGILHFLVACERCEHGEHGNKSLAAGRGYTHDAEPDTLRDAVMRMANWYDYTEEDLVFALKDSAANPQDWQHLVCNDVHAREFVSCATCTEWNHVRNEGRKS